MEWGKLPPAHMEWGKASSSTYGVGEGFLQHIWSVGRLSPAHIECGKASSRTWVREGFLQHIWSGGIFLQHTRSWDGIALSTSASLPMPVFPKKIAFLKNRYEPKNKSKNAESCPTHCVTRRVALHTAWGGELLYTLREEENCHTYCVRKRIALHTAGGIGLLACVGPVVLIIRGFLSS